MKQNKKRIVQCAVSLLSAALLLMQFGCAGETVRALDYSLESKLYSVQQDVVPQDVSPTPETPGETQSATPVATPTPAPTPTPSPTPTAATSVTPTSTDATITPTPQNTNAVTGTPLPSQTPELHRLTVLVQDASAAALVGARVSLYQDGALLYSGITGSDGRVSWMLPVGYSYRATASFSGYQVSDGDASTYDLAQDTVAKIILTQSGQTSEGTATPTPLPVPDAAPGKVTITAEAVTLQHDQEGFTLLDGVSAQTEFGQPVAVWVVDNGGYRADTAGVYSVTYGAFQDGELVTVTREVTVEGEIEETTAQDEPKAPTGSSKERYDILLAYREAVGAQLSERIAALTAEYRQRVQQAMSENAEARILAPTATENDTDEVTSTAKDVQPTLDIRVTNWSDVLAIFLAQNVPDEENPLNVAQLSAIPLDRLDGVFWDMNQIDTFRMDGTSNVLLSSKSYEDMADEYNMSAQRRDFLYELMQPEFQRTFASMTGNVAFSDDSLESLDALVETLPQDIAVDRKQVVETAVSLVGKVSYVFGGKYNKLGWNNAWGNANEVQESENIKISKDFGLDCSGFVSWVFINATGDPTVLRAIGNGSSNQWAHSEAIGWDEGRPGDLAFLCAPGERQYNHVGIIVSVDEDGSYLVAHCSSVQDGVVVTDGWSSGFRYLRRPVFFE
ncbi:MAG: CHAP domain-containing protein [Christensenella sp.]|nr:CHAP domain-containing protein [Christensenella sp.]